MNTTLSIIDINILHGILDRYTAVLRKWNKFYDAEELRELGCEFQIGRHVELSKDTRKVNCLSRDLKKCKWLCIFGYFDLYISRRSLGSLTRRK